MTGVADTSQWQGPVDYHRFAADGIAAVIHRALDRHGATDHMFVANLARGRDAKVLNGAYCWSQSSESVAAQVRRICDLVPDDVPVTIDNEQARDADPGPAEMTRDILDGLAAEGRQLLPLYLPHNRWVALGRPDLSWAPHGLWKPRYLKLNLSWRDAASRLPVAWWTGYGGAAVRMLQFDDTNHVGGRHPIDVSIFAGTPDDLATLWRREPHKADWDYTTIHL